ncbi:GNAT family N-acetyltransferase [Acidicapsa ligni]|uniref:GNAT family N-acetyltransferase n=1 Tax=Acidicapsa ligni TaxID=542300 RepID=UPI0021E0B7C5|nr:GNAT family N-acetyltransferase [Acidicapsa ligni]
MIEIRNAVIRDWENLWEILEPVIRAGEVFALPTDMPNEAALEYWFAPGNWVFVAEENGAVVGSYYLRANQRGGGSHVCNCGYVTAEWAGRRGVASRMCEHSLGFGSAVGFRAMQFNFVVSTNERAVQLWQRHGFTEVGRLPRAFQHPVLGFVDALVMWRSLEE